ncbi:hypothetical protein Acr_25g0007340 [Actinidia rufa]|uniref:Uncharacterized protein n=1 Tax=Actinidia rufa TaxID=165716 RepID=A0A7J0GZQ6_9ERIC|nr:hypothetical protein Acr_25g0007340 [Actinidia rufa]
MVCGSARLCFLAMLRKSVLMPKNVMALTIGASILGQVIGSIAERIHLKAKDEREKAATKATQTTNAGHIAEHKSGQAFTSAHCSKDGLMLEPLHIKAAGATSSSVSERF